MSDTAKKPLPDSVTIKLTKPVTLHEGTITKVKLRAPRGEELLKLGDPRSYGRTPDGTLMIATNTEVVRKYLERCIEGDALLIIDQLKLADGMARRDALFDFFDAASEALFR